MIRNPPRIYALSGVGQMPARNAWDYALWAAIIGGTALILWGTLRHVAPTS